MKYHFVEGLYDIRHALGDGRLADWVLPMRLSCWFLRGSIIFALMLAVM